jgi:hypothetical protein
MNFWGVEAAKTQVRSRPSVKPGMRYVLLVILIGLLVFLSNQLWILFMGGPLF